MTILFSSPIFGPVQSRRLGTSLGVNLLPSDGKVCTFDCIYCECGLNADKRPKQALPTRIEVQLALEKKLKEMEANNKLPDVITFAGNGEPTIHPSFEGIIDDTLSLRDKYAPKAKVSVLSNATFIHKESIVSALNKVDNNILKLDTVDTDYINLINQPNCSYDVAKTISLLKEFNGNCIIQTMFLKGSFNGFDLNNSTDEFVLPWLSQLKEINPKQVMIYTLARDTPVEALYKVSKEELDRVASLLKEENIDVQVSY